MTLRSKATLFIAVMIVALQGLLGAGAVAQRARSAISSSSTISAYPADAETISRALAIGLAQSRGQAVSIGQVLSDLQLTVAHAATIEVTSDTCHEYFVASTNNVRPLKGLYFQFAVVDNSDQFGETFAQVPQLGGELPEDRFATFFVQIGCRSKQLNLVYARARVDLSRSQKNLDVSLMAPEVLNLQGSRSLRVRFGPNLDNAQPDLGFVSLTDSVPKSALFPRIGCVETSINMRTHPSKNAPIIGKLLPGRVATLLAETPNGEWTRVVTPEVQSAFMISGRFVDCDPQSVAWHRNPPAGVREVESELGLALDPYIGLGASLVCAKPGSLFRTGPGQSYRLIGSARKSVPLLARATAHNASWLWVEDAIGRTGFVYKSVIEECGRGYLLDEDGSGKARLAAAPPDQILIAQYQSRVCLTGSVYVRREASTGAGIITAFPKGASLDLLADQGNWLHVERDGYSGYVDSSWAQPCVEFLGLEVGELPVHQ